MEMQISEERIATTWFGEEIPRLHQICIASWIKCGYEAHVYSYRKDIKGLPPQARIMDASEVMSEDQMFFLKGSTAFAFFSDIFRMKLMLMGRGYWADADYFAIRAFPAFDELMVGLERGDVPCNAVMWLPQDHLIPNKVVEYFERGELGPWTLTKPRWRSLLAELRGQEFDFSDLPVGHWGRHVLDYYTRRLWLRRKLQPQMRFFAPETYTGDLLEPGPFQHLLDDPEVSGLHLFAKHIESDFDEGSFAHWAERHVADELADAPIPRRPEQARAVLKAS